MERVRDYELKAFFAYVINVLESLEIPYMVVGGFAAIFSGQPRLTVDVDIVVDMKLYHVEPFVAAFPIPDYYPSEEGILDSLQRRSPYDDRVDAGRSSGAAAVPGHAGLVPRHL